MVLLLGEQRLAMRGRLQGGQRAPYGRPVRAAPSVQCSAEPRQSNAVHEHEWAASLQPGAARTVWRAVPDAPMPVPLYRYTTSGGSHLHPGHSHSQHGWGAVRHGDAASASAAAALGLRLAPDPEALAVAAPVPGLPPLLSGDSAVEVALRRLAERWDALPGRYRMVAATSLAFMICNLDKVNISVAIIPMARDLGWSPTVAGLVQSAFFWGYALSQIPGGFVTSKLGGRTTLPAGVGLWSAATAALPPLAGTLPGLCLSRAAVGLGEGIAPSAATDMIARVVDESERARAISFVFAGLHVGSLLGLLVCPPLIEAFGWESVFYLFGGAGLVWCIFWERLMASIGDVEPSTAAALSPGAPAPGANAAAAAAQQADEPVPWRAILRCRAFWALCTAHVVNNAFHYTMLAWLPTYYTDTMSLDLGAAARLALLPPLAAIAVSAAAGTGADALLARGVPKPVVRKGAQALAFLAPAACLTLASVSDDPATRVGAITAGLGMASFSLAGLYCNHADLSPRYAPLMLGMTNTAAAVPGIVGIAAVGALLDVSGGDWTASLFGPLVGLFLVGTGVFTAFGSTERVDLSNDAPFAWEAALRGALAVVLPPKPKDE